ncbi:(2Fe-2S)-binding protein [Pseudodonghicola xiamenensis]|uniref:Oxidoreductase n=1 Tax=Pseudodonghicola xiamenensis TaxID=337702 RepID=A0A8J3H9M6_9RHOB|nr:(2Fe-2S)-binding protein [Pseudodonghicola xiamenensis]GHH03444.1 oxidoreductase [Pseudodonghicola xiamenensis]
MIDLTINGRAVQFDGDPEMPLLWFLRDEAGMTGTKFGCGIAMCGACTVQVDGEPVRSCQTPVGSVTGQDITTIEAAEQDRIGAALQAAWVENQVPQCGYCQSGQIMQAMALLAETIEPTDADIDAAMSGNICRCATYSRIRAAIHRAAETLRA